MAIFHYGFFFDLPALALLLWVTIWLAPRLAAKVGGGRPSRVAAFAVASCCLISIEENINCGQFNCQTTLWPPTMTFLLLFSGLLGGFGLVLRVSRVGAYVAMACLMGLTFEVVLGGSAPAFQALDPLWFAAISVLTLISYACIFYLPLRLLLAPLPVDLDGR